MYSLKKKKSGNPDLQIFTQLHLFLTICPELDNPVGGDIKAHIYDISGRQVTQLHNAWLNPGSKSLLWNAADVPSGIYLLQVQNYQSVQTEKIVLLN